MTINSSDANDGSATVVKLSETAIKPTLVSQTSNPSPVKGLTSVINSTQDFAAFAKGNLEAVAASGQIWIAGVQALSKQFASTAKASFDESAAAFKALQSVKSLSGAVELQRTQAEAAIAAALATSREMAEASVKLIEQVAAPLAARVTVAVQSFAKAA
jgi:phasin family protein